MAIYQGTPNPDLYFGTNGNDTIYGYASNDTLFGQGGFDFINGGSGNDNIYGGAEADELYGHIGDDFIDMGTGNLAGGLSVANGGSGNDTILAEQSGQSAVFGETGNDQIYDRSGYSDRYYGGADIDTISYAYRSEGMRIRLNVDSVTMGTARRASSPSSGELDQLYAFENAAGTQYDDVIWGNDGTNILDGLGGNDTLIGYNGYNTFYDGTGNDSCFGGTGTDYFYAGLGTNNFYGSTGDDFVSYINTGFTTNSFGAAHYFQAENRLVKGNSGQDFLYDIETIVATNSNDTFYLNGSRSLTVYGLEGKDFVTYTNLTTAVTADLAVGSDSLGNVFQGIDGLQGSAFNDVLYGNDLNNELRGFGGLDRLFGRGGNDILSASVDESRVIADGGLGNDTFYGNVNGDVFYGREGNDVMEGMLGNDALNGGLGRDTKTGGGGRDLFVYTTIADSLANSNRDVIIDFSVADVERISVSAIDANSATATVNDAFVLDTNGVFTAGEIRQQDLGTSILLSFYVNADATPDMQILLQNVADPLAASSFIL